MAAPDNSSVQQITEGSGYRANLDDLLKERHATTASKLAIWVLVILAGTLLIHYVCVMILVFCKLEEGVKVLEDAFHSWLPFISGLASAAATFYFTREERK